MSTDGNSNNDLSIQLANLLSGFKTQPQNPKLSDSLQINLKLNSQNFALWTRMIRVAIGGRSKALLNHLTEKPPEKTDENYDQWEQDDLVVFSWLIQNIEPVLASNLTEFPTAKSLWDALGITYSSGKDKLQVFNLHVRANEIKQNGNTLENFWIALQGLWGELDRIDPNPMKCTEDIKAYTKIRSDQKLFQFLNALERKYDPIKREILRWDGKPTGMEKGKAAVAVGNFQANTEGNSSGDGGDLTSFTGGFGVLSTAEYDEKGCAPATVNWGNTSPDAADTSTGYQDRSDNWA